MKNQNKPNRISVSFPDNDYSNLQKIADEKKVSIAWVVRDAVTKYLVNNGVRKNEKK